MCIKQPSEQQMASVWPRPSVRGRQHKRFLERVKRIGLGKQKTTFNLPKVSDCLVQRGQVLTNRRPRWPYQSLAPNSSAPDGVSRDYHAISGHFEARGEPLARHFRSRLLFKRINSGGAHLWMQSRSRPVFFSLPNEP